ncbi:Uma2 family endonuclease [Planktothrix mougeotii]|uniref:Uma2 family endonuclease n=1 Tax=Planktothrix mougeotii LEGE 06226 TaxID=1828728 RepID=A0ABR9UCM3_9CYAN|nr:Uma2 family endonuclease [Planktothrix mougeotii]MBE9144177.1 Uma2 family endonuclease [Planktothrix mougeotii LEGE 06226]
MVQTPTKSLTLEEFLQLPETTPASEYIDGKITQKLMPQGEHSAIQTELATAINAVLKHQRIARAFSELRCNFGGRSIVPDVSVFTWESIPRQENGRVSNLFNLAPNWVIEILSPEQSQTKVIKNILHCLQHGTQMGWLIHPEEQTIFVYYPQRQPEVFDQPERLLPVPDFAGQLELKVEELFGWLLE